MKESRDYLEMTFRSINCFANDGRIDSSELKEIFDIALRDGNIDKNEIRVLENIISKIQPDEIDAPMKEQLNEIHQLINK